MSEPVQNMPQSEQESVSRWRRLSDFVAARLVAMAPFGQSADKDEAVAEGAALTAEIEALTHQLEAETRVRFARDRAIALVAHELRTPLNGILGMADLLGHTALTPEQTSYVATVAHSATALVNLVDDMLDAGKMAAGHWRLRPRSVDLVSWIEEIAELLAPRAQSKGLELAAYVAADVPARVEVDPEQLTRIVMNLAGNAIKFTERGGVTIEITAQTTDANTRLRIAVRDSGIGIAPEDHARIFGEYEQAKGTYVAGMPGTGLGLSIARDIATAMKAELTLDSAVGEGSQFTLALDAPVIQPGAQDRRPFAGRRFLIVSSSMIELSVLMRRLFDLGAQVDCASSLEAAREIIQPSIPVDAVLVDDGQGIDAIAVLELCRDCGLATIGLTTPAGRKRLDQLRALGLAGHLIKPIRTQTLQRILAKVVAGVGIDLEPAPAEGFAMRALEPAQPRSLPQASRGLRVLLADDNEINTLLAISMIGRQGHRIETAENGAIAVESVRSAVAAGQPFDVILMDLHMPVVDGFEAIAMIRADEAVHGLRATIIALTADSSDFTAQRALETGADLALTKPVQASRLADIFADIETAASGVSPRHRA